MTGDKLAQARQHIIDCAFEEAELLLRPLAEQGQAEAQYLLGYLFFTAAEISEQEAEHWLRKAAEQNHADAWYFLANFPDRDERESLALLHQAAELGAAEARRDLGALFATGEGGAPKDEVVARRWYTLAAEQGHADAQYNLGTMWLEGEGGPQDVAHGLHLLEQAALNETPDPLSGPEPIEPMRPEAAGLLGDIYERGLYGTVADPAQAARWRSVEKELNARQDAFYAKLDAELAAEEEEPPPRTRRNDQ